MASVEPRRTASFVEKDVSEHGCERARSRREHGRRGEHAPRPLVLAPAERPGDEHARPRRYGYAEGDEYLDQRDGHGRRCHGAAPEPVADEHAVDYRVHRIEQQPHHLRQGIFCKKLVCLAFIH
ncbi:MAG TPA: hypothetical protein H9689_05010 [Firmicutes bacterium]|nr:hypothetical protein [Bacillota bacterium]